MKARFYKGSPNDLSADTHTLWTAAVVPLEPACRRLGTDHTPNPTKFAGDSTNHRHASTRCPAEEAGTIVCPETPALRAERGDSSMLCEAQSALIVIFKKS